jgi:hypothetical protein
VEGKRDPNGPMGQLPGSLLFTLALIALLAVAAAARGGM